jgi:hypothetical protein
MQIQNFHVPISKIIPEFDGIPTVYMNLYPPASGIALHIVGELSRRRSNVTKALKQAALFVCLKRVKKIENINGNEQP